MEARAVRLIAAPPTCCVSNKRTLTIMSKRQGVFVTVGTTAFDELVKAATEEAFLKLLVELDYGKLTLQIGRGEFTPRNDEHPNLEVNWYRYKESLANDMKEAQLIISHGGAGSIIEALSLQKRLVVVINDKLMNNHQTELARQLHKDGHLLYTTHRELYPTVGKVPAHKFVTFEPGQPKLFGDYLDKLMGFSSKQQ